jgi:hypothetical protein
MENETRNYPGVAGGEWRNDDFKGLRENECSCRNTLMYKYVCTKEAPWDENVAAESSAATISAF